MQQDVEFDALLIDRPPKDVLVAVQRDERLIEMPSRADAQIASRFRPLELPRWQDDESLVKFLRAFERLLPLKEPSRPGERSTARLILDRSGSVTGEVAEMLTLAAAQAIRRGDERITPEILDHVYPTRRPH